MSTFQPIDTPSCLLGRKRQIEFEATIEPKTLENDLALITLNQRSLLR